jgi:hypothetical protein
MRTSPSMLPDAILRPLAHHAMHKNPPSMTAQRMRGRLRVEIPNAHSVIARATAQSRTVGRKCHTQHRFGVPGQRGGAALHGAHAKQRLRLICDFQALSRWFDPPRPTRRAQNGPAARRRRKMRKVVLRPVEKNRLLSGDQREYFFFFFRFSLRFLTIDSKLFAIVPVSCSMAMTTITKCRVSTPMMESTNLIDSLEVLLVFLHLQLSTVQSQGLRCHWWLPLSTCSLSSKHSSVQ